jgi:hypothetical protein
MRKAIPLLPAALLVAAPALADPPSQPAPPQPAPPQPAPPQPAPPLARYSHYEQESVDAALKRTKGEIDPSPLGKTVEDIVIVPFEVFEKRDFIPSIFLGFVNWFHVTSRPYVIEREVLIGRGQPYSQALVDETARNLRNIRQLSLVLLVPLRGSAPDRVKLLVITKDIWSLRLNSDYRVAGGKLENLLIEPSEENFLGIHQSIFVKFFLDQGTYQIGARYQIPRIAGSRIQTAVEANAILNRRTGSPEGSYGSFLYGQPLYSTDATWAWEGSIGWRTAITRSFIGSTLRTYDAVATPGKEAIPYLWKTDQLDGHYEVTRSFGRRVKTDLTAGVAASRHIFRAEDLSAYSAIARAEFLSKVVPVSDTQIGPYFQVHSHNNAYVTVLDFNTLGLQEDFLVGHDAYLRLYPVSTALGSSRNFFGVYASAAYTVPIRDGIARAYVESVNELTDGGIPDGSINAGARFASPRTPAGRLHFDARVLHRYANYLNVKSAVGGDTRPRGYPSSAFIGKDLVAASLEFRSRAVEILGCQLAGAAFFDSGDAFDGFAAMRLKQSVGFGARILFPQLDRVVMRVDWGIPVTRGFLPKGGFPGDIVLTFRQAFTMPVIPTGQ